MKMPTATALVAILSFSAAAGAQTTSASQPAPAAQPQASTQATAPTVGATVYDSAGAVLGRVDQVTAQAVVVDVDGTKVGLPPTSVGAGPQGLRVAITKADLLAQAKQAQAGQQAQLQQQLTPGAAVRGAAGASVGTVKEADAQYVTLTTAKGDVRLPIASFAAGANGPTISLTADQLDAAIAQAGGGATSSSAADSSTSTEATGTTGAATAGGSTEASTTTTTTETRKTTKSKPRR